jgi:hypothetical protein
LTSATAEDYVLVKKRYPEAFLKKSVTYGKCEEYIIFDPDSGRFVGPTAFSPDTAWMWAAERLRRGEE